MGNKSSRSSESGNWRFEGTGDFRIPGTPKIVYNAQMGLYADQYYVQFANAKDFGKQCQIYRLRSGIMLSHLVQVVGLIPNDDYHTCSGKEYSAIVMVQRIPWRLFLQHKNSLSLKEGLYILTNVLNGVEQLCEGFDRSFLIYPEMIGINTQGCVKVWHNVNFSINYPDDTIQVTSIKPMIQVILDIIETYVDHEEFREFSNRINKIGALSFTKVKQEVQNFMLQKKISLSINIGVKIINRGYYKSKYNNNLEQKQETRNLQQYQNQYVNVNRNSVGGIHIKRFIQEHNILQRTPQKKSIRKSLHRDNKSVHKISYKNQQQDITHQEKDTIHQNQQIIHSKSNNKFQEGNKLQNSTHLPQNNHKIGHNRTRSQNINGKTYQEENKHTTDRNQQNQNISTPNHKNTEKTHSRVHSHIDHRLNTPNTTNHQHNQALLYHQLISKDHIRFNNIHDPLPSSYVKFPHKTYLRTTRFNAPIFNQTIPFKVSPDMNPRILQKNTPVKSKHQLQPKIQNLNKKINNKTVNDYRNDREKNQTNFNKSQYSMGKSMNDKWRPFKSNNEKRQQIQGQGRENRQKEGVKKDMSEERIKLIRDNSIVIMDKPQSNQVGISLLDNSGYPTLGKIMIDNYESESHTKHQKLTSPLTTYNKINHHQPYETPGRLIIADINEAKFDHSKHRRKRSNKMEQNTLKRSQQLTIMVPQQRITLQPRIINKPRDQKFIPR